MYQYMPHFTTCINKTHCQFSILIFKHLTVFTYWYSFLWVIRVKVSVPWGLCTQVSPSDRWITVDGDTEDTVSLSVGFRCLSGTSASWPGWSWTLYLRQDGGVTCGIQLNKRCLAVIENNVKLLLNSDGSQVYRFSSDQRWPREQIKPPELT